MNLSGSNILNNQIKTGAKLVLAAVIGFGAFGTANAGNIGIDLYLGNGSGIHYNGDKVHYRHNNRGHYRKKHQRGKHYRQNRHHRDHYRPRHQRQVCGPRRAVNKAYRLGLDYPQVHRIKERRVIISGYQYGYRTKMVFKRYSRCHLIKTVSFN